MTGLVNVSASPGDLRELELIVDRGYRTITDRAELLKLGFSDYQARVQSLAVEFDANARALVRQIDGVKLRDVAPLAQDP